MRIQQLPPVVANQIAAGEVIERPASVVKELLENSLDAGATSINIELSYGGLNQIKISDNGYGIVAEDLPLAVAAHATSKITKLDDLYAIESMGFRGEALASIASVAKVTISSRPASQEHAMMLRVQGSEQTLSPCARNIGTTIDVVDLFFNTPVRKRFLKGEKLEFQAIEQVVKRFALSAPDIALTLKHNGKLIFSLPPALNEQSKLTRMSKILGSTFMSNALYLDVKLGNMALYGWLSSPEYQRSQNDKQWVYINQRMVKDKLINHALKQAYDGILHPGRFPACLLYFTMSSAEVDVNVHPTKHEVRFQQPRLVHDFFTSQLTKVLAASTAKYFEKTYEPMAYSGEEAEEVSETYIAQSDTIPSVATQFQKPVMRHQVPRDAIDSWSPRREITAANKSYSSESELSWTVLNHQHVLILMKQQPYVVDALALQQQWIYSQLKQSDLPLASRPLLVPVHYSLSLTESNKIDALKKVLEQLGIHAERSATGTMLIRSVPVQVPHLDIHTFLNHLVDSPVLQTEQLLLLLSQSQLLDLNYLGVDERKVLNQLLLDLLPETGSHQGLFVALTPERCRMLLHV
ncbi:DNA mismatch repair protein MutL [Legionella shakespearei DSM 23087]|uniref:DNA mismatch repair protein MutL n=2 Tax=Legionella shakespearei TaxID=45075 RepID=A0A0W0YT24_9GAMM|nr:DNA mismatch repair endonuclease MutL [Legionella shakespearei]KTD59975.1 DNA mismatch repair protein MutL [Legionella shakespearei DSM 23087]